MRSAGQKGAVAAGHRLTAEAAASVLREGGNAADAAIAALAMACLCEPVLCSPGGGGFAMVRDAATGQIELIDFFPHTPLQRVIEGDNGVYEILADFGTATQAFHIGPATTATPGFFAGVKAIHGHGSGVALADLFAPTIDAARNGIIVTPYQYYLSTVVQPILLATPDAARLFALGGELIKTGETFCNPGLADALGIMARDGFAASEVGAEILAGQRGRGHLSEDDLSNYQTFSRQPHTVEIAGAQVHLNPLPAASGVLIGLGINELGGISGGEFAEALRQTDLARREAGNNLAALIGRPVRQRGTTHVSVIDAAGNACAVTVSNGEGNGELAGPFGFMPNNILGEEDVNPYRTANWPQNTRLASMMCPAIIDAGDGGLIALGSGGSNRIRSAMLQVIARLTTGGMTLADAIAAPRLHVENGHLDFEDLFDDETGQELAAAFTDHRRWPEQNMFFGGVHATAMDSSGRFSGDGDRRRDGVSIVVE